MVGRLPGKSAFHVGEGTVSVVCNHVSSRESYIHPIMVALELQKGFRSVVIGLEKIRVFKRVKCDGRRKVRHVSSKESNVTGVIFDSFSCHMAGDLIIFP